MSSLCFTCRNPTNCKKCGNCLLIKYCSVECQRINYVEHRVKCEDYKRLCVYLQDKQKIEITKNKNKNCQLPIDNNAEMPFLELPPPANPVIFNQYENIIYNDYSDLPELESIV